MTHSTTTGSLDQTTQEVRRLEELLAAAGQQAEAIEHALAPLDDTMLNVQTLRVRAELQQALGELRMIEARIEQLVHLDPA